MFRFVLFLGVVISSTSKVLADLAPVQPYPGCVWSKHVIQLEEEIPGYRFFLFHGTNDGGETIHRELKLSPEKALVIPDTDTPPLVRGVIAVPDKVVEELKNHENLAKLCSKSNTDLRPPGVVVRWYRGFFNHPREGDPRRTIIMQITVSPDNEKGVKFSTKETSAPLILEELPDVAAQPKTNEADSAEDSKLPRFATIIAGIALTVAIATAGLWFFRRKPKS